MRKLSDNIRSFRKSKNLTQSELAGKLHKAGSTIRMWELDKASPDAETLLDLSRIFGVSTDVLLGNTELLPADDYEKLNSELLLKNRIIDKINKELMKLNHKQLKLIRDLVFEISHFYVK